MVAQAQFSASEVRAQPGSEVAVTMTLINLGNRTETFTLVPSGLLAGWVRIEPPTVTLFGGSFQEIGVTLRPPEIASTPAGAAPLTIRVIPQDEPDDVVIAETTAIIGAFHDRRLQLLQPVVRSRRRATFEFLVENNGNSQASCRLHLIDTSRRLDGDFDPPAVGVEPGGNSLVRLKMKAVRRHWRRGSRTLPFTIEADQQGFPTAVASGTFVQTPAIPDRIGRRAAALLVFAGALTAGWFALLKPATERAARDAVSTSTVAPIETVETRPGDTTPPNTSPTVTATTLAPEEEGELFARRFVVAAPPGQTVTDQYEVPAGQELRITDALLQNISRDGGSARLLRNEAIVVPWNLDLTFGNNDPVNLISPLVFTAGDLVIFQVTCTTVGDFAAGVCNPALLLSGTLIDV